MVDESKSSSSQPKGPNTAERAFLEFIQRLEEGEEVAFDRFCAERPEIAGELTQLHAAWQQLSSLLGSRGLGFSWISRAAQGRDAAPEIPADAEKPVHTSASNAVSVTAP